MRKSLPMMWLLAYLIQAANPWEIYMEQGDWNQALVHIEAELAKPTTEAMTHFWHGRALFELQHWDRAIQAFKQASKALPTHSDSFYWLGVANLEKLKKSNGFQKGILAGRTMEALEKAIDLNPSHIGARTRLGHYYLNAPAIVGGSKRKAEEQAKAVMLLDPTQGAPLLASFLRRSGKLSEAARVYEAYLKDHPDPSGMNKALGQIWVELKAYDKAVANFERAYANDPQDHYSLYLIGRTAALSHTNTQKGLASLNAYLALKPRKGLPGPDGAHWRMGMIYEHSGDPRKAKFHYEKAISLNPNEVIYQTSLKALSNQNP